MEFTITVVFISNTVEEWKRLSEPQIQKQIVSIRSEGDFWAVIKLCNVFNSVVEI